MPTSLRTEVTKFYETLLLSRPRPGILGLKEYLRAAPNGPTRRTRLRAQSAFHGQHSGGDEGISARKTKPPGVIRWGEGGGACIAADRES